MLSDFSRKQFLIIYDNWLVTCLLLLHSLIGLAQLTTVTFVVKMSIMYLLLEFSTDHEKYLIPLKIREQHLAALIVHEVVFVLAYVAWV